MSSILSMEEISTLDRQIDQLYDYKPIPENEVKALCDKVSSAETQLTPYLKIGQGDSGKRKQCSTSEMSRHCLRRYSRIVPRPYGTFQNRR